MKFPKGKSMATVKVGEKGQIVIPKDMRNMFDIQPGDSLLLMADEEKGIAIVNNNQYMDFASAIFNAQKKRDDE